jgi:thioredoxin reductase
MNSSHFEYIVLGAGPAGVQLGYYLQRDGLDYQILEGAPGAGAFFQIYPRHRTLISINKVYTGSDDPEFNMRHDWNSLLSDENEPLFKDITRDYFPRAASLPEYLHGFVQRHQIRVRYDTPVTRVSREGERFVVESAGGERFTCSYLVVATGVSRAYVPDIPGIEHAEGYEDVSVDPADFINQRVLIIGKRNSAFETADNLVSTASLIHLVSPTSIDMAWQTHYVGDLRAINNNFLDTYQLKSQNAVLDAHVGSIEKRPDGRFEVTFTYRHAEGEVETLVYDRIIRCTGFRFDAEAFDESARPELVISDRFPRLTCEWESANQPGMYFAGTLMQSQGYKKATSGFIHGFRYNVRALARMLSAKNHQVGWPAVELELDAEALARHVLGRINRCSDLWQQQAFLADAAVVGPDGQVEYMCGMPVAYIRCFVVTLEFGPPVEGDPFKSARIRRDNVVQAASSNFLHPAIREYENGAAVSEHHVIEDLEAQWTEEEEHVGPLLAYFDECIQRSAGPHAFARTLELEAAP